MNYRIEELAIEAGGGPSKWYNDPNVLEKFAELIVQECAEQLCHPKFRKSTDENKVLVGQGLILNHFGIEE